MGSTGWYTGKRVRIHSLLARADLEGCLGLAGARVIANGITRYKVLLEDGTSVGIKASNLEVVRDEAADEADARARRGNALGLLSGDVLVAVLSKVASMNELVRSARVSRTWRAAVAAQEDMGTLRELLTAHRAQVAARDTAIREVYRKLIDTPTGNNPGVAVDLENPETRLLQAQLALLLVCTEPVAPPVSVAGRTLADAQQRRWLPEVTQFWHADSADGKLALLADISGEAFQHSLRRKTAASSSSSSSRAAAMISAAAAAVAALAASEAAGEYIQDPNLAHDAAAVAAAEVAGMTAASDTPANEMATEMEVLERFYTGCMASGLERCAVLRQVIN